MPSANAQPAAQWSEQDSQTFIDYGRYFVPERELQIEIVCDLIGPCDPPFHILELCCGEGLLAEALLARFPQCQVRGLDGSGEMLQRARTRLADYGERFQAEVFNLASDGWRRPAWPVQTVVSSLAIHHLDGPQKQTLFRDVHRLLNPGGTFVIADVFEPASLPAAKVAAKAWDAAVRRRSLELDGHTTAFDVFRREKWNLHAHPDPEVDKPSKLFAQLEWLTSAGFVEVDVYWLKAGHAIYGGRK